VHELSSASKLQVGRQVQLGKVVASRLPSSHPLLDFQRSHGNRFVQRVLAKAPEAEGGTSRGVPGWLETAIHQARGGGQSLPIGVRARMEPFFSTDFGVVQVHTDSRAAALSRALGARAWTLGTEIFFGEGEYAPETSGGRELLAHELTHVVQQAGPVVQGALTVSQPEDEAEQEAARVGQAFLRHEARATKEGIENRRPPGGTRVSSRVSPQTIRKWKSLGYWTVNILWGPRKIEVWVGSVEEWKSSLKHMSEEEYHNHMQGFLRVVAHPKLLESMNDVTAPSQQDIKNFITALYSLGVDLKIPNPNYWPFKGWAGDEELYDNLKKVIEKYQTFFLEGSPPELTDESNVKAVAEQGGPGYRTVIVANAAATALKALTLLGEASYDTDRAIQEEKKDAAYNIIEKSGSTIRYTLSVHKAAIAKNQAIWAGIFDAVWNFVPEVKIPGKVVGEFLGKVWPRCWRRKARIPPRRHSSL